jgi:hypothetical protein
MTTAVYSWYAGMSATRTGTREFSWAFCAVFVGIAALWGWLAWLAIKSGRGSEHSDQEPRLSSPRSWGEPDLAPPSTSPEALAEVAELEALWRQPRRRRRAASD